MILEGTRRDPGFTKALSTHQCLALQDREHLLAENGVAVYAVQLIGQVSCTILPGEEPIRASLLQKQALFPGSETAVAIVKKLVSEKLRVSRETLAWVSSQTTVIPGVAASDREREPLERMVENARQVKEVIAAEAPAAGRYFEALRGMKVTFQKVERRCVDMPSHWRKWAGRFSRRTGVGRDATDPLNALLNFGYAIAAAETLIAMRGASLDPWLDIVHSDQDKRPNLVCDLIEPLRPRVDRLILETVVSRTFKTGGDFHLMKEGVCRLSLPLAREMAQTVAERLRDKAQRVVIEIRKMIVDAPTMGQREPALAVAAQPKKQRVCCVSGEEVFGNRK